jgi:hypothetical protein
VKSFIVVLTLALSSLASAQDVSSAGTIYSGGDIVSTTPVGASQLLDPALTSWDTSLAATPAPGDNICVGTLKNVGALPGGCATSYSTAQLQTALNNANCGQTIILQNTIYAGQFTVPSNVVCTSTNWIIVERDVTDTVFPTEGTRVDPCYIGIPQSAMPYYPYPGADLNPNSCARHMPQLKAASSSGNAALRMSIPTGGNNTPSIAFWRFVGIEFTRDQSTDIAFSIVDLNYQPGQTTSPANPSLDCGLVGTGISALPRDAVACHDDQPNHLIFDRCIFHGDAQRQTSSGISLGGVYWVAILDSYGYDVGSTEAGGDGDAKFYGWGVGHGYTGSGWGKFKNNFTAASTMASLFCGGFTEPLSPATGNDGVPQNVWWDHDWLWKNLKWDTQFNQTFNTPLTIEGVSYPPANDQELIVTPTAVDVAPNTGYTFSVFWGNDSFGGYNRLGPPTQGFGGGNVTVDGVTMGNSTTGLITRNGEHGVSSGPWLSQNQITYTYTACTGVGLPIAACNGVTTVGTHSVLFSGLALDQGRTNIGSFGHNRTLTATATVTVTATPSQQMSISPKAPDLSIQPSYSDANGNKRQFCATIFATPNFTSTTLAWKVDGFVNGNASVGQMCSMGAAPCLAPGPNDQQAAYCSGTATGPHTISATSATGITDSSLINVSTQAAIVDYDFKPFTSKNGWEAKCLSHGLLQYSLIENGWGSTGNGSGQQGTPILLQPANQASQVVDGSGVNVGYGPQHNNDISLDHDDFLHFGGGFVVVPLNVALGSHRISLTDLLCDDCNYQKWSHAFVPLIAGIQTGGTSSTKVLGWTSAANPLACDISFNHITELGLFVEPFALNNYINQFRLCNFTFTNSIFAALGSNTFVNANGGNNDADQASGAGANNTEALAFQGAGWNPIPFTSCRKPQLSQTFYCNVSGVGWEINVSTATVLGTYVATPTPPGSTLVSPYAFHHLALLDSTASPSVFTSSPIWQPTHTTFGFVNYSNANGGDYRPCTFARGCQTNSLFAAGQADQASDGRDLGADIDGINPAVAAVRYGNANPPPTVDLLSWALMPLPTRSSNHIHGSLGGGSDTFSILDTDSIYPVSYPKGIFFWAKHPTGNPWDIEKYSSTNAASHWITEDGDAVDANTCVANGFSSCFLDPNAYKRFLTPVQLLPRMFTYGSTVTIDTPGTNTFVRTTNCELPGTSTNVNLGDIRSVTTGPFNMTWGGSIDSGAGGGVIDNVNGVPTIENDYFYGGTIASGNFNDKESTFYVQGFGRVAWFFYQKVSGTYVLQQHTISNVLTSGTTPPNFPCGAGQTWWQ